MGNCQAIDAAALVIQHPDGKIERTYWPMSASEVMKMNPGHYVSLIIPLPSLSDEEEEDAAAAAAENKSDHRTVRFTRVKLLRPTDTLALGHAYRLLTSQEVMKVLKTKKYAKTKKSSTQPETEKKKGCDVVQEKKQRSETENTNQATRDSARQRVRTVGRSKLWRPSLQSIAETGS